MNNKNINDLEKVVQLFNDDGDEKALALLYKMTNDRIVQLALGWRQEYEEALESSYSDVSYMYEDLISYIYDKYRLNEVPLEVKVENQNYKSILGRNNHMQNVMALNYLLDIGRSNLLNDEFYNKQLDEIENKYKENKGNPLMTKDFVIEALKISRQMATLDQKDIYAFIQNEIEISKEPEQENDSIDYDY